MTRSCTFHVLLLLFVCLAFFGYALGDRDLTSSHEARAAQNAQMILDEGCWLVPRLYDRHLELQKPPLYYWLVALIAWLRGGIVDAWAVRLPSALAALGTVLWMYWLAHRCGRSRAGFLGALMLASFVHFTATARVGRIDMPLTFTIALALGGTYLGVREQRRRWFMLSYTALGLGLLLKGPIAIVLPGAVILAWLGSDWRRQRSFPATWFTFLQSMRWGIPWTLALALPWYVLANSRTDNQIWEIFLWYHNVERGLGSERLAEHPIWFYCARMWLDLLPWGLLLPLALWHYLTSPQRKQGRVAPCWRCGLVDDEQRYGLLWFAAMLVVLSLMRFKRADYLVPALPGAAWFLGLWLDQVLQAASRSRVRWIGLGLAEVLVFTYMMWIYVIVFGDLKEIQPRNLARSLRERTDGMVIFFRTEDHALAFHVGRPLDTILEWENLDIWARQPQPIYVVMPAACAAVWQEHLQQGALEEIDRWSEGLRRPLVLLRNRRPTS